MEAATQAITPEIYVDEHGFIKEKHGIWYPPINAKQFEIFDCYDRYLLISGPRFSGKTIGTHHKVIRHAWDENQAVVAIVCKTIKNAKASGVWTQLINQALPIWVKSGIGLSVTDGPKMAGDTRMSFFKIRNRWGTESEVQLHSIDYCNEVESKFKGTIFSLFWFSEIDQFDDQIIFNICTDQLRLPTVPYERHQFIGDCNPPESGPNNWLHDLWFKKVADSGDPLDERFSRDLRVINVGLDDNPQLDPRQRESLEAKYSSRKSLYNRFVLGVWEEDLTNGHFSDVFKEDIHVMGNIKCPEEDRQVIVPSPACRMLLTSWDIGDISTSAHIVEKIITKVPKEDGSGGESVVTKFAVLDELLSLEMKTPLREFVEAFMDKMRKYEEYVKTNYQRDIQWRSWSDKSAFRFRSAAESNDELIVREVSKGKILMAPAPKYAGSVKDRVKIVQTLLQENRLFISANCIKTIAMIKALRKGKSEAEYVARNNHRHPFDSLSYCLMSEAPMDLLLYSDVKVEKARPRIVAV